MTTRIQSTPAEILARCDALGIRIWAESGKLKFDAPAGAFEPELKADLIELKAEVIAALSKPVGIEVPDLTAPEIGELVGEWTETFQDAYLRMALDLTCGGMPALHADRIALAEVKASMTA